MAGGQAGNLDMHQEGFPLIPHHPLGSCPTEQGALGGAGCSSPATDTFPQVPALSGDFNQTPFWCFNQNTIFDFNQTPLISTSTKHSVHRAECGPPSPPVLQDRQHLPCSGCCAKPGKAGRGLNADLGGRRRQMALGKIQRPPWWCQETFVRRQKSLAVSLLTYGERHSTGDGWLMQTRHGLCCRSRGQLPASGANSQVCPAQAWPLILASLDLPLGTANQSMPGNLPGLWHPF